VDHVAGPSEPVAGRAGADGAPGEVADAQARYAEALAEYRRVEAAIDDGSHPCLAGLDDDRLEEQVAACRAVLKPWWPRLDALKREAEAELLALPLADLPRPLLVESAVLGERVYLCADETQAETVKASGLATYTAAEVRGLLRAGTTPDGLRAVHRVKREFRGQIVAAS
jgi:hypothetical protein